MLILFHGDTSVASAKVRLALAEKGLAYESRLFDLRRGAHRTPEYLALNPAGVVPTLVHDGLVLRESNIILEYLEEAFRDPKLMPEAPADRAKVRLLMREVDHLHEACSILSSAAKLALQTQRRPDLFPANTNAASRRKRERQERLSKLGFDAPDVGDALSRYGEFLQTAAAALNDKPWLSGDSIGLGDCAALPYLHRADSLGLAVLWAKAPEIADWLARMRGRPSFQSGIVSWLGPSNPYRPSAELASRAASRSRQS